MVLYDFTKTKAILSETGATNDAKIQFYGDMADKSIIGDTVNVRNMTNPPTVVTDVLTAAELDDIKSFATQMAVGYFYKFESGDEGTIAEAKEQWIKYFNNKFRRQAFKVAGGELGR